MEGSNLANLHRNPDGWGFAVNNRDFKAHYFHNGDSPCGRKTGGGLYVQLFVLSRVLNL